MKMNWNLLKRLSKMPPLFVFGCNIETGRRAGILLLGPGCLDVPTPERFSNLRLAVSDTNFNVRGSKTHGYM